MTFLILCLVGIAIALTLLTVWYWIHTDPRRRRGAVQVGSPLIDPAELPVDADQPSDPALSRSDVAETEPADRDRVADDRGGAGDRRGGGSTEDDVPGPVLARQTWDFVAAAKRAESDGPALRRSARPAAPRIAVPDRAAASPGRDDADELAVVRRRREQEAARGLSDEVWKAVRQSVFDKLEDER